MVSKDFTPSMLYSNSASIYLPLEKKKKSTFGHKVTLPNPLTVDSRAGQDSKNKVPQQPGCRTMLVAAQDSNCVEHEYPE